MKTSSAKAKGRNHQIWIRNKLIELLGIKPEDVQSRSMGAAGEDIILSLAAREMFPYSVEAKNQEAINVWKSYEQALSNTGMGMEPLLIIKRNLHKPLAVVDAEYFIQLHQSNKKKDNG